MPATVLFVSWCLVLASLSPRALALPRPMDLVDVLNKTVCPIRVDIDVDVTRIPRRIKMLRCAGDGYQWCEAKGIPRRECCAHAHAKHRMECVEIRDNVVVHYPKTNMTKVLNVAVGCTCLVSTSTEAHHLSPG